MSRKSFIIMALVVNLTICLTLCVVMFTDKNRSTETENTLKNTSEQKVESSGDELNSGEDLEKGENETTENDIANGKTTGKGTAGEETTKIVESQVGTDTQPVTYKNTDDNGRETTSNMQTLETTSEAETTTFINGTTAVINSSCNIRLSADVGGNVIGTANAGASYRIEPSKCSSNWIAIYLDGATIGYISTTFCSIS